MAKIKPLNFGSDFQKSITFDIIDSPNSSETNVSVSYDHDCGHQITMSMRLMSKYLP